MVNSEDYVARAKELNATLTLREATKEDGHCFVSLFNTYYARKTSLAYFHWQFFNSPFTSRLFTAFDGEKLVGYYGVKIYPLTAGLPAGFAVDVLTDEPYRKRGIAYLLEDAVVRFCREQSVSILTALPNAYGNAAFKALGWKSAAKIDTLVKDDFSSSRAEPMPFASDRRSLVEFYKDSVYRKWRFDENPCFHYEKVTGEENSFAMTKLFRDPVTGLVYRDIVDIVDGEFLRWPELLLEKIVSGMSDKKVKATTTWALPHTEEYLSFMQAGFKIKPQDRYFCVKVLNPKLEYLSGIVKWRLVQADSEIF